MPRPHPTLPKPCCELDLRRLRSGLLKGQTLVVRGGAGRPEVAAGDPEVTIDPLGGTALRVGPGDQIRLGAWLGRFRTQGAKQFVLHVCFRATLKGHDLGLLRVESPDRKAGFSCSVRARDPKLIVAIRNGDRTEKLEGQALSDPAGWHTLTLTLLWGPELFFIDGKQQGDKSSADMAWAEDMPLVLQPAEDPAAEGTLEVSRLALYEGNLGLELRLAALEEPVPPPPALDSALDFRISSKPGRTGIVARSGAQDLALELRNRSGEDLWLAGPSEPNGGGGGLGLVLDFPAGALGLSASTGVAAATGRDWHIRCGDDLCGRPWVLSTADPAAGLKAMIGGVAVKPRTAKRCPAATAAGYAEGFEDGRIEPDPGVVAFVESPSNTQDMGFHDPPNRVVDHRNPLNQAPLFQGLVSGPDWRGARKLYLAPRAAIRLPAGAAVTLRLTGVEVRARGGLEAGLLGAVVRGAPPGAVGALLGAVAARRTIPIRTAAPRPKAELEARLSNSSRQPLLAEGDPGPLRLVLTNAGSHPFVLRRPKDVAGDWQGRAVAVAFRPGVLGASTPTSLRARSAAGSWPLRVHDGSPLRPWDPAGVPAERIAVYELPYWEGKPIELGVGEYEPGKTAPKGFLSARVPPGLALSAGAELDHDVAVWGVDPGTKSTTEGWDYSAKRWDIVRWPRWPAFRVRRAVPGAPRILVLAPPADVEIAPGASHAVTLEGLRIAGGLSGSPGDAPWTRVELEIGDLGVRQKPQGSLASRSARSLTVVGIRPPDDNPAERSHRRLEEAFRLAELGNRAAISWLLRQEYEREHRVGSLSQRIKKLEEASKGFSTSVRTAVDEIARLLRLVEKEVPPAELAELRRRTHDAADDEYGRVRKELENIEGERAAALRRRRDSDPLAVGLSGTAAILADRRSESSLRIRLANASGSHPVAVGAGARLVVRLETWSEKERPWGLCRPTDVSPAVPPSLTLADAAGWRPDPELTHAGSGTGLVHLTWTLTRTAAGAVAAGEAIELTLSGFTCSAPSGRGYLFVSWREIGGRGSEAVPIERSTAVERAGETAISGSVVVRGGPLRLQAGALGSEAPHHPQATLEATAAGLEITSPEVRFAGLPESPGIDVEAAGPVRVAAPVRSSADPLKQDMGNLLPVGAIMAWSGTATDLPVGWRLCDGKHGTPDLRGACVVAEGEHPGGGRPFDRHRPDYILFHRLTDAQLPRHQHALRSDEEPVAYQALEPHGKTKKLTAWVAPDDWKSGPKKKEFKRHFDIPADRTIAKDKRRTRLVSEAGAETALKPETGGGTGPGVAILPPFYALAYIQKVR